MFNQFHQVGVPFQQADAVRAAPTAMGHPKSFALQRAESSRQLERSFVGLDFNRLAPYDSGA